MKKEIEKEVTVKESVVKEHETVFIVTVSKKYEKSFWNAIDELYGEIGLDIAERNIANDNERAFMRYLERKNHDPFLDYPDPYEVDYPPYDEPEPDITDYDMEEAERQISDLELEFEMEHEFNRDDEERELQKDLDRKSHPHHDYRVVY
jgi:hypothetical protein